MSTTPVLAPVAGARRSARRCARPGVLPGHGRLRRRGRPAPRGRRRGRAGQRQDPEAASARLRHHDRRTTSACWSTSGLDTVDAGGRGLHHPRQRGRQRHRRARSSSPTTFRRSWRPGLNPIVPVVVMDEREPGNVVAVRRRARRCGNRLRRNPFHRQQIGSRQWKSSSSRMPQQSACSPPTPSRPCSHRKPTAVLGLATGSSPLAIYDELAARCDAGRISFRQARGFTLDEYVGLPADHPERYRTVIDTVFVSASTSRRERCAAPTAWPPTSRSRARTTRRRSARPAVSICRSSGSAPTGISRSTSPGRRWRPAPGSRR